MGVRSKTRERMNIINKYLEYRYKKNGVELFTFTQIAKATKISNHAVNTACVLLAFMSPPRIHITHKRHGYRRYHQVRYIPRQKGERA